ncbi:MAG: hypothetical protein ACI4AB_02490 [Acetatifactor sp.]
MKKSVKKRAALLLAGCFCEALCSFGVSAANQVPEMEIEVALRTDASAYITQTWYTETDDGVELCWGISEYGDLALTDS